MDIHNLSVQEFSIIPLQSGIKIETPKGIGDYEGITSSGIVAATIDGGLFEFSWSEVNPILTAQEIVLIQTLTERLKIYINQNQKY